MSNRTVYRMDSRLLVAAFVLAGLAFLFILLVLMTSDDEADQDNSASTPSTPITITATFTETATLTPTWTVTPTNTVTPTRLPSETPTETLTPSNTPTDTPTSTASPTLTPSLTETPYPEPEVNPIVLADTYAGEPILISGEAQPEDAIILLNNAEPFAEVTADADGEWEIELDEGLEAGSHLLELYAVGAGGAESPVVPLGFIVNDAPTATFTTTYTATFTATITPSLTQTPRPTLTKTPTSTTPPPTEASVLVSPTGEALIVNGDSTASLTPSLTATLKSSATLPPTEASVLVSPTAEASPATATPNSGLLPASLTPSLTATLKSSATLPPTEASALVSPTPNLDLLPASLTPSLTATLTSSATPTVTFTATQTPSATLTASPTLTNTATLTSTSTQTAELDPTQEEIASSPTATLTLTKTATASPTATRTATEVPLQPLAAPRFNTPTNPYSPFAPILISGQAEANTTIRLTTGGAFLGEITTDANGQWQFNWENETRSARITAVASDDLGRVSREVNATIAVELIAPRITSPRSGRTVTPATEIGLVGTAPALAPLVIQNGNQALVQTTADAEGNWAVNLTLVELGTVNLQAVIQTDTQTVQSNSVRITVADMLAPETGGEQTAQTNQVMVLLLGGLVLMGGVIILLIGRMVALRQS